MRSLSLAVLLLIGCGGGGGATTSSGSCDTETQNNACIDYVGGTSVVQTYQNNCSPGTWSTTSCTTTGRAGGCQTTDTTLGLTYTTWFYSPNTTASVMGACTAPSTFVQ